MGMREPTSGLVFLGDTDISDWGTREIREAGVGYIPEDRHRHALLLEAPLWENRILGHQTEDPNVRASSSTPLERRPTPSASSRSTTCAPRRST